MANIYFSDVFEVSPELLEEHGAFNISLITDLPLFIDPFLLFNSEDRKYKELHDSIIEYMRFLKDESKDRSLPEPLVRQWFTFPEIRQNWLGFSKVGNRGRGLGKDFAKVLNRNLNSVFSDFGQETVTLSSHIEKFCLIRDGVGRDMIRSGPKTPGSVPCVKKKRRIKSVSPYEKRSMLRHLTTLDAARR